jgi:hypothetical protein
MNLKAFVLRKSLLLLEEDLVSRLMKNRTSEKRVFLKGPEA